MKSLTILSMISAVCMLSTGSPAQEQAQPKSVEALQREVRSLEVRVQALSAAVKEIAELTLRSAAIWSRAVGEDKEAGLPVAKASPKAKPAASRPRPVAAPAPAPAVAVIRGKVNVPKGEPIAYAYVENVFAPPRRGETVVIDQKNKNFVPSWAVIRRGTSIEFPNHDNVYHNVFSHAVGNAFDLGLYNAGTPAKAHAFQSPGAVDIYCNIHPNMAASVLVVPNDLYAKVQPDGTFVIRDVPVGQRKVVAWSPSTGLATQWVELGADGSSVELSLVLKSRAHKNKAGRAYGSYE